MKNRHHLKELEESGFSYWASSSLACSLLYNKVHVPPRWKWNVSFEKTTKRSLYGGAS